MIHLNSEITQFFPTFNVPMCNLRYIEPEILTPQWQSSERNLLVTIVQKMDIFYSGILNLEFPNFFFNF